MSNPRLRTSQPREPRPYIERNSGKIGWAEQLDLAHALRLCGRTTEAAAMHLASTLNVKHEALTVSGGGGWTCTSLASPGPSGWVGLALAGVLAALLRRRMGSRSTH